MKRKSISIFYPLLFLIALFTGCQNQFVPTYIDNQNSLLWEIKKDGQPTSYMFGTMHLINKKYYDFSNNLNHIINSSEAIIMELGSMPNPVQAMLLMTMKDKKLQDIFTDKDWQTLIHFYKKEFDMSKTKFISMYNNFKPFFLFQSIVQDYFEQDAESYDLNIMSMARENNIELIGLETFKEQVSFFDMIPHNEMATMIIESLENYEGDKSDFEKLQSLYSEQKVDELIPLMKEQSPEFLKYEDIFLTNRNKNWIPKLDGALQKKSCFIAVGAAHLFEENGLISLLKDQGYSVVPIKK